MTDTKTKQPVKRSSGVKKVATCSKVEKVTCGGKSTQKSQSLKQSVENILTSIVNSSEMKKDNSLQFFLRTYKVDLNPKSMPFELLKEIAANELKNLKPIRTAKPGKAATSKTSDNASADLSQSEDEGTL